MDLAVLERPTKTQITLEQWEAWSEDEPGEVVDGRVVEEEMPNLTHEAIVAWLVFAMKLWLRGRGGFVFGSDGKYEVMPGYGRKPDATVYLPGSKKPEPRGLVRTPPDIAIEVVSPSPRDGRRDRIEKAREYGIFGVRWYWLVDPGLRTVEIFERGADGRWVCAIAQVDGAMSHVPGCEGLVLDLDSMWADADRLEGPDDRA